MQQRRGFALITVVMMIAVLMALVAAYFMLTRIELATTKSTTDQTSGFYAAEAGLNLRAAEVRRLFTGFNRPSGTSPSLPNPCSGGNQGSGDFACKSFHLNGRQVQTYVVENPNNPTLIRIPPGEAYQNLNAQEYRYNVFSVAQGPEGEPEAILEMRFKSRVVPMFQFAIFYQNDLEFNHVAPMTLTGPVHTNGDIYLDAGGGSTLNITSQVTVAGQVFRGDRSRQDCNGTVNVANSATTQRALPCNGSNLRQVGSQELSSWNGWILSGVQPLTVPPPSAIDPPWRRTPPGRYWTLADMRVVLDLTQNRIEVRDRNNLPISAVNPTTCPGAFGQSNTFYNNREQTNIIMLEIDVQRLLDCIHTQRGVLGIGLDDTTQGGLVVHLSVQGPNSNVNNNYGVRLRNGAQLASSIPSAPAIKGLTVVTDQALYVEGDYNANNWIPAALISDSINLLSNNWASSTWYPTSPSAPGCAPTLTGDQKSNPICRNRSGATPNPPNADNWTDQTRWLPQATTTTLNAAVLTGASITPSPGGPGGGGVHNIFRFHEHWGGNTSQCCSGAVNYNVATFNYTGSIVSLWQPRGVNGQFFVGPPWYQPPRRNWSFDQRFNLFNNLPPMSPVFVYLRQELFEREFEQP